MHVVLHLAEKHQTALTFALDWINENYKPIAIILSGSLAHGSGNESSDLDLYVIHREPFRQRVQKYFNNVPCEVFINNPTHIQDYFKAELDKNRPVTANMMATGTLIQNNSESQIFELIDEAKRYSKLSKKISSAQRNLTQYLFANQFEDATDLVDDDPVTCLYILDKLVTEIIEYLFLLNGQPLTRIKQRLADLTAIAPRNSELIQQYYIATTLGEKYNTVKLIVTAISGYTGFYEWETER